eukprot:9626_1
MAQLRRHVIATHSISREDIRHCSGQSAGIDENMRSGHGQTAGNIQIDGSGEAGDYTSMKDGNVYGTIVSQTVGSIVENVHRTSLSIITGVPSSKSPERIESPDLSELINVDSFGAAYNNMDSQLLGVPVLDFLQAGTDSLNSE